jgi:hypothetical protein
MKATNLMIGDWVNINFDVDYKTGNPIYGYVQVNSINKDGTIDVNCTFDISVSMQDGWDLKLIKPIPLTEEILHKNGFKNDVIAQKSIIAEGASIFSVILISEDNRITLNNIDEYINSFNKWSIHIDTEDMRTMCTAEITYVHELQHVLNLCKIKKEIII